MRILITGGGGVIGRNLYKLFITNTNYTVYAPNRSELNLLDAEITKLKILEFNPDVIIHTAIQGGIRLYKDSDEILINNILMYDNLINAVSPSTFIILFGSGSEYDRTKEINNVNENEIYNRLPTDYYGLSKNIITKKALESTTHTISILRLFGCFCYDEEPSRFISTCFNNIKNNVPIEISYNKYMDYMYINDVYITLKHIIDNKLHTHMNLVYQEKYTLYNIATLIKNIYNIPNYPILLHNLGYGPSYTGNGTKLNQLKLPLNGLLNGLVDIYKQHYGYNILH